MMPRRGACVVAIALLLSVVAAVPGAVSAEPQERPLPEVSYWVTSGWEPKTSYLNRRGGADGQPGEIVRLVELNRSSEGWKSVQWGFELVDDDVYRIVNKWHPETGYLTRMSTDLLPTKEVAFRPLKER